MDIKNIIIFIGVFFIIMWLQHNDDKKFSKTDKRISLYDKIKIPFVSAIFVILVKELDLNNCINFLQNNMINKTPISNTPFELLNSKKALDDIFIGPPDF
jgi:hypothetical protein